MACLPQDWMGFTWQVKDCYGGPGPCTYRPENVWLDSTGYLHLKISHVGDAWYCAEVMSMAELGFGTYQWQTIGGIDRIDKMAVLGLFQYPRTSPGGTNEIDFEFTRWEHVSNPHNGHMTIYPATGSRGVPPTGKSYPFTLHSLNSTHRYTRNSRGVSFKSFQGHVPVNQEGTDLMYHWDYFPTDNLVRIPQEAQRVHMNLWLCHLNAPSDGQEIEVIINEFSYTPLFI